MEISVNINRKDVVLLSVYLMPRLKSNWILAALIAIGIFVYVFIKRDSMDFGFASITALLAILGGIISVIVGVTINIVWMLFMTGSKSGVLGLHHYTISKSGLEEKTDANQALHLWAGIQSVRKIGGYILIQINGYLFHVIPLRSFESREQGDRFYIEAKKLFDAA